MCRGYLLTRFCLLEKGVQCLTNCVSCPSHHDDLAHVFFNCPFIVQVWQMTGLWGAIQHPLSSTTSTTNTIFLLLETLSIEFNQRLTSSFWSIWKYGNYRVWDDVTEVSATIVERAKKLVVDWQFVNVFTVAYPIPQKQLKPSIGGGNSAAVGTSVSVTPSSWQHPLSGRYKCNIDVAFSSHLNRTGLGVRVQDLEGTFVLAKVVSYPCFYSIDVGEALGLHFVLQWPSDMQFDNVGFEMDSKLTCDVFHANRDGTSKFGCIISPCRSLFSFFFTNSRVEFVRR